jgi:carbonic anhydrase
MRNSISRCVLIFSLLYTPAHLFAADPNQDPESYLTQTKLSQSQISPADALNILKKGNDRFVASVGHQRNLKAQVKITSSGQFPFAAVLSCMDSRVSTELIFDQGVGDVFSLRVAGNVVNEDILGSLEYAGKIAATKLIAVVGHTHCGAIKGACDNVELGNLTALVHKIGVARDTVVTPAGTDRSSHNKKFVEQVENAHIHHCIQEIRERSKVIRDLEEQGSLIIVGAVYDVQTGKVNFIDVRPAATKKP